MEPAPPENPAPRPPPLGPFQFTLLSLMIAGTVLAVCCSAIKTLRLRPTYFVSAVVIFLVVLAIRSWRDAAMIAIWTMLITSALLPFLGWRYVANESFQVFVPLEHSTSGFDYPPFFWGAEVGRCGVRVYDAASPWIVSALVLAGTFTYLRTRPRPNHVGSRLTRGAVAVILAALYAAVYAAALDGFAPRLGIPVELTALILLALVIWHAGNCRVTVGACLLAPLLYAWTQQMLRWALDDLFLWGTGPAYPLYWCKPAASLGQVLHPVIWAATLVLVVGPLIAIVKRRRIHAPPYSP